MQPAELLIDGKSYMRAPVDPQGSQLWTIQRVASQLGDNTTLTPVPLAALSALAGISQRSSSGIEDFPPHVGVEYTKNGDLRLPQIMMNSAEVTTLTLGGLLTESRGFRIGGWNDSRIGGLGGTFGGGSTQGPPTTMLLLGDFLYVTAGSHVHVVDPSGTPAHVETISMGNGAQANSAVRRNRKITVANGPGALVQQMEIPRSGPGQPSVWVAGDLFADVFGKGKARGYRAVGNVISNVAPGADMAVLANYSPGDEMGDGSPVTALAEFSGALIGATEGNVHRFDFANGFESVAILPELDAIPHETNGLGLRVIGSSAFFPHIRGLHFAHEGQPPRRVGLGISRLNESPLRNGRYGKPAYDGDWVYYPYFIPSTDPGDPSLGETYILCMRHREPDDPGTDEFIVQSYLHLPGVECRVAAFWPGTATEEGKLFFSMAPAGGTGTQEVIGWCYSDPLSASATPATLGEFFLPNDDLGISDVIDELAHLVIPFIEGVDPDNTFEAAVSYDNGASYTDLEVESGQPEVTQEGLAFFYPPVEDGADYSGVRTKFRFTIRQQQGAPFVIARGTPIVYIFRRPRTVNQYTTVLWADDQRDSADGRTEAQMRQDLQNLVEGQKVKVVAAPSTEDVEEFWAKVVAVQMEQLERKTADGQELSWAARVTLRQVEVAV